MIFLKKDLCFLDIKDFEDKMSNPMFLSSTPPPMDDFDDDFSGFETADVTFNNYDGRFYCFKK